MAEASLLLRRSELRRNSALNACSSSIASSSVMHGTAKSPLLLRTRGGVDADDRLVGALRRPSARFDAPPPMQVVATHTAEQPRPATTDGDLTGEPIGKHSEPGGCTP